MKKIPFVFAFILCAALIFSSCASPSVSGAAGAPEQSASPSQSSAASAQVIDDPVDVSLETTSDFTVTPAVEVSDGVWNITSAGEYTLSGKLEEGRITVNAGDDDEVKLILNGVSISSSQGAPVQVINAGEVTLKSEEDSYNVITDSRAAAAVDTDDEDNDGDAAVWADCDLKLTGKGTLIVEASYDNGVKSKDDLSVKNVTLKVTAPGNALKGNDSVEIESGELILVSTASDGIKTSNSSVSSKGNQKGSVVISGGKVDIYSACDGISAAYDVVISDTETCAVNIFTADYSDKSGEASASSDLYLVIPTSLYDDSLTYTAVFYNEDDTQTEVTFSYDSMVYSGRTAAYYGLIAKAPSGYSSVMFFVKNGSDTVSSSDGEAFNSSMNAWLVSSVSGTLEGDWVRLGSSSGSDKTSYSAKGVKAANSVTVSGGTVAICAMDDGIHANGGDALENGSSGAGGVTVSGGSVSVTSADDGIHADGELNITGGVVDIAESHEGLEGNVINISGGSVTVNAGDDGINACAGDKTPLVNITGGYLDVTTPSGDTDALDSNGSVAVSGGTVIIKGGASSGGMAGSVDVDGSVTVTGGTVIALGGICSTPSSGSVNTYISSGTSFTAGDYVLKDSSGSEIVTFTLSSNYSSVWIASEALSLNGEYLLTRGSDTVLSWTQTSSTVGSAGNSAGFGPGMMGRR